MQGRCNNINVYAYIEQVWYYECIDWCLYQVVFFFIFCKDDSEMLRLSKKLSNFPLMFTEKRHSCKPPPPTNI
jgi:hypothetical protein